MLLLESDWQFRIPHQQSQKYKKPVVKCQTPLSSVGEVWVRDYASCIIEDDS